MGYLKTKDGTKTWHEERKCRSACPRFTTLSGRTIRIRIIVIVDSVYEYYPLMYTGVTQTYLAVQTWFFPEVRVVSVAAAGGHAIALTGGGKVFTWGQQTKGLRFLFFASLFV